jgi:hypothetical protein
MLCLAPYLSQKLARPTPTKDGGALRTVRDACDYMTGMGKKRELLSHWQRVLSVPVTTRNGGAGPGSPFGPDGPAGPGGPAGPCGPTSPR